MAKFVDWRATLNLPDGEARVAKDDWRCGRIRDFRAFRFEVFTFINSLWSKTERNDNYLD